MQYAQYFALLPLAVPRLESGLILCEFKYNIVLVSRQKAKLRSFHPGDSVNVSSNSPLDPIKIISGSILYLTHTRVSYINPMSHVSWAPFTLYSENICANFAPNAVTVFATIRPFVDAFYQQASKTRVVSHRHKTGSLFFDFLIHGNLLSAPNPFCFQWHLFYKRHMATAISNWECNWKLSLHSTYKNLNQARQWMFLISKWIQFYQKLFSWIKRKRIKCLYWRFQALI